MYNRVMTPVQNSFADQSNLVDNNSQRNPGAGNQNNKQIYMQDADGDLIGEENKLEENFNQLQLNMPKASNMREQYSQPIGGPVSGQNFSNFGKVNQPQVQQFHQPDQINVQISQHEQVKQYNKIHNENSQ